MFCEDADRAAGEDGLTPLHLSFLVGSWLEKKVSSEDKVLQIDIRICQMWGLIIEVFYIEYFNKPFRFRKLLRIYAAMKLIEVETSCRPSKGRRCIPDVVLKKEGSMEQTCQNINVHVVNTDICWDLHEWLWIAW